MQGRDFIFYLNGGGGLSALCHHAGCGLDPLMLRARHSSHTRAINIGASEYGGVCQHTLPHTANPISLDATLCCNSNTNKAQARLQSTCGPAVSACNELNCDENKTMHRPLLKIPVKYMDTEKAQAEHSAENTTLAVTVIS